MTEQVEQEVAQPTIEEIAKDFGWKPKEEFEGEESNWTDAVTYVKNTKTINDGLKSKLQQVQEEKARTEKTFESLKNHYVNVRSDIEKEFKDQITYLKQVRQKALEEDNVNQALQIDGQIDNLKEIRDQKLSKVDQNLQTTEVQQNSNTEAARILSEWKQANPWYKPDSNDEISETATDLAVAYAAKHGRNGQMPTPEGYKAMLDHVSKKMKDLKPNLFENPRSRQMSKVDEGGETRPASGADNVKMSSEEEKVYENFVRMGVKGADGKPLTRKQYADELRKRS